MIKVESVVFIISYIIGFVGFLSVVQFINVGVALLFLVMFFVGIIKDIKKVVLLHRVLLNIISLFIVLALVVRVDIDNMIVPVVETLLLLLGIKFLEQKHFRDFMQIYIISVFLLSGSALLSINIMFMVYFTIIFFGVVISVILLTYYSQDKDLSLDRNTFKRVVIGSMFIPLSAIPITAFIFTVLPRTEYPVFNFLNVGGKGKTGFSDTVQLGDVSEIQEDNTTVMRIKTDKILDDENTYIRGIVLNFFDGKRWYRRNLEEVSYVAGGETVKQEIILEPTGNRYLLSIDTPVKIFIPQIKNEGDRVFVSSKRLFSRVKYTAVSQIGGYIIPEKTDIGAYLQLPSNLDKRVVSLSKRLKGKNEKETIENTIKYLKENFRYSLKNLSLSQQPLYDFLFERKQGNCEYFASAAALFLRLNSIPTRIVAGYRGVKYNRIGDYYTVPNRFAHTWIEVLIDGRWVRYDPTPTASSQTAYKEDSFFDVIQQILDAVEYAYINSIVNFDVKKQVALAMKLRDVFAEIDLKWVYNFAVYVIVVVGFVYLSVYLYRFINIPYERRLLNAFLKRLEKHGYKKSKQEGLEEFVGKIADPQLKIKALRFVKEFERIYYKDTKINREDYKRLIYLIRDI